MRQSKNRESFIVRMKINEKLKHEAKVKKEYVQIKRKPERPTERHRVKGL